MKVTGWTYYENPSFFDIRHDRMREVAKIYRQLPSIPRPDNYSKEEFNKKIIEYSRTYNENFDRLYNEYNIPKYDSLIDEMKKAVIEDVRNNGYHFSGDCHQNTDYGTPIIDNKYLYCCSQREWGGLIADAFPEEFDKNDSFSYCIWAWSNIEDKIKIPDKSLWIE